MIDARDFPDMAVLRSTEVIIGTVDEAPRKPLDPKIFEDAVVFFG